MTAAGYVGIEPEAAGWLASALERASSEVGDAARSVQALVEEAGEPAVAWPELLELERWASFQSEDIRRRAGMAAFDAIHALKACAAPSTHPLARAARAVWANATQLFGGAVDASIETAGSVWQLVPGVDGWTQAWVGIPTGLWAAVQNPRAALDAASGYERWEREGFAYWAGGLIPDLASFLVAGAGVAKTTVKVADTSQTVATVLRVMPERRHLIAVAPPPRRTRSAERAGKAATRAADAAANGHTAARHGRRTTLEQQRLRADTGMTPDGHDGVPMPASRFLRWEDARVALKRAPTLRVGNESRVAVPFDHIVGEGFMAGTLEYRVTNVVVVRFDEQGRPFTAFPDLKAGL